jgi:putative ABC transport system ATP-binding protein
MNNTSVEILKIVQLNKTVQSENSELTILNNINFTVNSGESVALVGTSGSGKTTLLSILAGLDTPSTGQVYLNQQPLHQLNEEQRSAIRAQHVGFIFQQFLLVSSLTALENVMLPAELAQNSKAKALALQLLADVGLANRSHHYPNQLSGGEQQRVAIARAFITKPDILFADEPTGNLDRKTGEHIEDLLFNLNQQFGTTLVLVTHDQTLAKRCQRQIVLDTGTVIKDELNPLESLSAKG